MMIKEIIDTMEGLNEAEKFKKGKPPSSNQTDKLLGHRQLTQADFPVYMEFRRKRLSVSQVLLIDLLCANEDFISKEFIDKTRYLGALIELKTVAIRDTNKYGQQENFGHNCYEEWCRIGTTRI